MRAPLSFLIAIGAIVTPVAHLSAAEQTIAKSEVPLISLPHANYAEVLRQYLRGTAEQKTLALDIIREVKAVGLIPEVISAISDPTALPRQGDTGWGFVGHQAATVMGEISHSIDRVTIDKRGRGAYSFYDDMYEGGFKLRELGRLDAVQTNWKKWWDAHRQK